MDDLIRKTDSNIRNSDSEFSSRINKEIARNEIMKEDLKNTRVKYDEHKETLRILSKVKPPVIFSSNDYKSAMKAFSDGKYDTSLKLFNRLFKKNPPKFLEDNIHFGIGSSFYRLKKFSNAQKHFQKILDDFPMGDKLFNSYVMLGVIHNLQGEKSRALFLLDQALNSNPPERMKTLIKRLVTNISEDSTHVSN
jgi:TolA-binding protein